MKATFNTHVSHLKFHPKAFADPVTGFVSVILLQVLHYNLITQKLLVQDPVASWIANMCKHIQTLKCQTDPQEKKIEISAWVACLQFGFLSEYLLPL